MVYRVIGLMSGSSLDGLDIAFVELENTRSGWQFTILNAETISYTEYWKQALTGAPGLNAYEYLKLHSAYGNFTGHAVNEFINKYNLHHQVQLIASHGHTSFHNPQEQVTAQLGDGAAIAAVTGINTISDLRHMDVAFGGQGAPIVPRGEALLFPGYNFFLNLGGIANLSCRTDAGIIAFDVCPANRILNLLANEMGNEYDENGIAAAKGSVHHELLSKLNAQDYYKLPYPKSLSNEFGTGTIYPLVKSMIDKPEDALCTYAEHIALQVKAAVTRVQKENRGDEKTSLLITGGGAFNTYLINRITAALAPSGIEVILPAAEIISYKEAAIMALLGVLRWREEYTVPASVTGARRNSIGGAAWIGQEA